MITALELAKWVIHHRKGHAFKNYTLDEIVNELVECSENGWMQCVVSADGTVIGVVTGTIHADKKVLFVNNILATSKDTFKQMFECFVKTHPDYTIEACRKGKRHLKFNNPKKVVERI